MSNLTQFIGGGGSGIPLYSTVNMVNQNTTLVEFSDGTKWYYGLPTAPFPYTSEYSYLPDTWVTPHALFPGPESDGTWLPLSTSMSIAYNPSSGIYITSAYFGDTTNGHSYYRSTNHGQTWTLHQFPFTPLYNVVSFTGGKFVAYANSTTTNGILYSTDGINWTATNAPASINPVEVISDGGSNFFTQATSTTGAYSGDGGATWTSVTGLPSQSWSQMPGQGRVTYNAGAGLFILAQTTAGAYATSPTGQTWTNRNTQPTFAPYSSRFSGSATFFASNSTTTIAVGGGGFFATTTDGLTWSNHNYIPSYPKTSSAPNQVYYDGTRFVVRFNYWIWYSTNGIDWTQGKPIGGCTLVTPQSNGVLFVFPLYSNNIRSLGFRITNVTATNPNYVICPVLHVTEFGNGLHYRIK